MNRIEEIENKMATPTNKRPDFIFDGFKYI